MLIRFLVLAFGLGTLVFLLVLPPTQGFFLLDPRRIGMLGLLLAGLFVVVIPSTFGLVYERRIQRAAQGVRVFDNRIESGGPQGSPPPGSGETIRFNDVRELSAHNFGITIRLWNGETKVLVSVSEEFKVRALAAMAAWCGESDVSYEREERSGSPLPLIFPVFKTVSIKLKRENTLAASEPT